MNLRDIDAKIAEHVMDLSDPQIRTKYFCWVGLLETCDDAPTPPHTDLYDAGYELVPHYSTDIAAAWQVVEKLRTEGFDFFIETRGSRSPCSVEVFRTGKTSSEFDTGEIFADTVPLAICKAALKARGIEAPS